MDTMSSRGLEYENRIAVEKVILRHSNLVLSSLPPLIMGSVQSAYM